MRMHPKEVRTRARRGLILGAKAGRRWVSSTEPFLSSVGRTVEEPPDIRRYELWIVSRTEGQTGTRGSTENDGPRGAFRQVIP
jgi:hypothetical protein